MFQSDFNLISSNTTAVVVHYCSFSSITLDQQISDTTTYISHFPFLKAPTYASLSFGKPAFTLYSSSTFHPHVVGSSTLDSFFPPSPIYNSLAVLQRKFVQV